VPGKPDPPKDPSNPASVRGSSELAQQIPSNRSASQISRTATPPAPCWLASSSSALPPPSPSLGAVLAWQIRRILPGPGAVEVLGSALLVTRAVVVQILSFRRGHQPVGVCLVTAERPHTEATEPPVRFFSARRGRRIRERRKNWVIRGLCGSRCRRPASCRPCCVGRTTRHSCPWASQWRTTAESS
jgi:hypothetical protein